MNLKAPMLEETIPVFGNLQMVELLGIELLPNKKLLDIKKLEV